MIWCRQCLTFEHSFALFAVPGANGLFLFLHPFFFPLSTSPADAGPTSPMDQPFKSSTGLFTTTCITRRRYGLWWYQVSFSYFEPSVAHTFQSFNRNFWRIDREWLSPVRNLLVGFVSWHQLYIPDLIIMFSRLNLETLMWSRPSPPTTLQTTPPPRSAVISGGDFAASKWVVSLEYFFFSCDWNWQSPRFCRHRW